MHEINKYYAMGAHKFISLKTLCYIDDTKEYDKDCETLINIQMIKKLMIG